MERYTVFMDWRVSLSALSSLAYIFNAISTKISSKLFHRYWPADSKISSVILWYSSALELVKSCICQILTRKKCFSTQCLLGTRALAGTRTSHSATLQEKMLHHSVLVSSGTHHFCNELTTSTKVPLYMEKQIRVGKIFLTKKQSQRAYIKQCQELLQVYSNQDSVTRAKGQTHKSME